MSAVDFRKLIEAGVHFGHEASRWCPKMKPYIWGAKNNIHLIDVSKTAQCMENAAVFLRKVVSEGKQVLFVGTKRPAQDIIKNLADKLGQPYVNHRWIGGTLNNYSQVRKSLTKLLHLEDVVSRAREESFYTKKELSVFQKMIARLNRYVGGLRSFSWNDLGAVVIIDVSKEQSAVSEATSTHVPVIGLVDTNSDPSLIDYVIPTNDDSPKALEAVMNYIASAVQEGLDIAKAAEAERAKSNPKIASSIDRDRQQKRGQVKQEAVITDTEMASALKEKEAAVEVQETSAVLPVPTEEVGDSHESETDSDGASKIARKRKTTTSAVEPKTTIVRRRSSDAPVKKVSRTDKKSGDKE